LVKILQHILRRSSTHHASVCDESHNMIYAFLARRQQVGWRQKEGRTKPRCLSDEDDEEMPPFERRQMEAHCPRTLDDV
jgi:hypothetical protein